MTGRGQASVEWAIILGVSVAVLTVILYANQSRYEEFNIEVGSAKAENSLRRLVDAVDFVYQQGEGARMRVYFTVPPAAHTSMYTTVNGTGVVEFTYYKKGDATHLSEYTSANLTGAIPNATGGYCLDVVSLGRSVNVTRSGGSC